MPDWSRVQAVFPEFETEVQMYEHSALNGSRKIKGRFLPAKGDSVTLKLKDGQVETFQRKKVRKVLAYRELGKPWPGWFALGISLKATRGDLARAWFVRPLGPFPASLGAAIASATVTEGSARATGPSTPDAGP